jgi:hypothetical protein
MPSTLQKPARSGTRSPGGPHPSRGNGVPARIRPSVGGQDHRPDAALPAPRGARRPAAVGLLLAGAAALLLLTFLYVRVSYAFDVNSDNACAVLQAETFAHGNYLLRGWYLSTVPFLLEVPFYAAGVLLLGGIRPVLMYVVPALFMAVAVLLAVWLAGRGSGRRSPTLGRLITFLLIGLPAPLLAAQGLRGPGHLFTVLLLLVALLVIDAPGRFRWRAARPLLLAGLLGLALLNDHLTLYVLLLPMALAGLWRMAVRRKRMGHAELSLVAAGGMAWALSKAAVWLIAAAGGFVLPGIQMTLIPKEHLIDNAALAIGAIRQMTGACFFGQPMGPRLLLGLLHLPGLALILISMGRVLASWQARAREEDPVPQLLAAGMLANLVGFLASGLPFYLLMESLRTYNSIYLMGMGLDSARYLLPFIFFGAVLAGRVGIEPWRAGGCAAAPGTRRLAPGPMSGQRASHTAAPPAKRRSARTARAGIIALVALSLVYVGSFAQLLCSPNQKPSRQELCDWLRARGLRHGYSSFWNANIVTALSGGEVKIRQINAVENGRVLRSWWLAQDDWYREPANFIVCDPVNINDVSVKNVRQFFGPPAEVHQVGWFTILVWDHDIAPKLLK